MTLLIVYPAFPAKYSIDYHYTEEQPETGASLLH